MRVPLGIGYCDKAIGRVTFDAVSRLAVRHMRIAQRRTALFRMRIRLRVIIVVICVCL